MTSFSQILQVEAGLHLLDWCLCSPYKRKKKLCMKNVHASTLVMSYLSLLRHMITIQATGTRSICLGLPNYSAAKWRIFAANSPVFNFSKSQGALFFILLKTRSFLT